MNRTTALILLAIFTLGVSAAHVAADVGAWTSAQYGSCNNGISARGDSTHQTLLGALSTAQGTEVIAQTSTNCTTPNATYGNSQTTTCPTTFAQHRCISNP